MKLSNAVRRGSLVSILLLFLCACTTTVKPKAGSELLDHSLASTESESRLKNIPPEELIRTGNAYLASGS
jgi:hypothetical protein